MHSPRLCSRPQQASASSPAPRAPPRSSPSASSSTRSPRRPGHRVPRRRPGGPSATRRRSRPPAQAAALSRRTCRARGCAGARPRGRHRAADSPRLGGHRRRRLHPASRRAPQGPERRTHVGHAGADPASATAVLGQTEASRATATVGAPATSTAAQSYPMPIKDVTPRRRRPRLPWPSPPARRPVRHQRPAGGADRRTADDCDGARGARAQHAPCCAARSHRVASIRASQARSPSSQPVAGLVRLTRDEPLIGQPACTVAAAVRPPGIVQPLRPALWLVVATRAVQRMPCGRTAGVAVA